MVSKNRGDVSIELTSPMGTKSTLLPYRRSDFHRDGFHKWPFMTVLSWGENPAGDWTFIVRTKDGAAASLDGLELVFYGTSDTPAAVQSIPEHCHEQCDGKCANAGAEYCDVCKHFRVASTHECVEQCPVGTFVNAHMCRDCPNFCGECEDDHRCIKCQDGERNFVMNTTSRTCEQCCNADTNNAPCCDCDANDDICVWTNSIPVDDDEVPTEYVSFSLQATVMIVIALLIVVILLVAVVIGIKCLCRRADAEMRIPTGIKLPTINGSQKYTKV